MCAIAATRQCVAYDPERVAALVARGLSDADMARMYEEARVAQQLHGPTPSPETCTGGTDD